MAKKKAIDLPQSPKLLVRMLLAAKFTQEEIAAGAGISQPTVHRLAGPKIQDYKSSVVDKIRRYAEKHADKLAA